MTKRIVYLVVLTALLLASMHPVSLARAASDLPGTQTPTPATTASSTAPESTAIATAYPGPGQTPTVTATPETNGSPTPDVAPTAIQPTQPAEEDADAPETGIAFRLKPRFIRPGGKIELSWQFPKEAALEIAPGNLSLKIELPQSLSAVDPAIIKSQDGNITLPVSKKSGKLALQTNTCPDEMLTVKIALFDQGQAVGENTLLAACNPSRIEASSGGKALGLHGKVAVNFPVGAVTAPVDVVILPADDSSELGRMPETAVRLEAFDAAGNMVSKFSQNLSIEYRYDPELYTGNESTLHLTYFDEASGAWEPVATEIDMANKVLIGTTNHFSYYDPQITDFQGAQIPTLESFQVNGQSGAATWSLPLNLPPTSPANPVPGLTLSYNSQTVDAGSANQQGSWVGLGWNLNLPSIDRNMNGTMDDFKDDTFTLSLNGVGGNLIETSYDSTASYWRVANNDAFNKIEFHADRQSWVGINADYTVNSPKSGEFNENNYWLIYDKTGNIYEFRSRMKTSICFKVAGAVPSKNNNVTTPVRWGLTRITTPLSRANNSPSVYITYSVQSRSTGISCPDMDGGSGGTADIAMYPKEIIYPNGFYKVKFNKLSSYGSSPTNGRYDFDTDWINNARQIVETSRLTSVEIDWNTTSTPSTDQNPVADQYWQKIREYQFKYAQEDGVSPLYPNWVFNGHGARNANDPWERALTLHTVQEFDYSYSGVAGADNVPQPITTFAYSDNMHLTNVNNGYGATVQFAYTPWSPKLEHTPTNYPMGITHTDGSVKICGQASCSGYTYTWPMNGTNPEYYDFFSPGKNFEIRFSYYHHTAGVIPDGSTGFKFGLTKNGTWYLSKTIPSVPLNPGTYPSVDAYGTGSSNSIFLLPTTMSDKNGGAYQIKKVCEEQDCYSLYSVNRILPTYYRVTSKTLHDNVTSQDLIYTYSYVDGNNRDTASINRAVFYDTATPPARLAKEYYLVPQFSAFNGNTMVTETGPDGSKTVTEYFGMYSDANWNVDGNTNWDTTDQLRALVGSPINVKRITADGKPISWTHYDYDYTDTAASPVTELSGNNNNPIVVKFPAHNVIYDHLWWPRTTYTTTYTYDNSATDFNASSNRFGTKTQNVYDTTYGNLTRTETWRWDGGQSLWVAWKGTKNWYYPNTTNNLIGLLAQHAEFYCLDDACATPGAGKTQQNRYLSITRNIYDSNTGVSVSPSAGIIKLTGSTYNSVFDANENVTWYFRETENVYDAWGNVVDQILYVQDTGSLLRQGTAVHTEISCYGETTDNTNCNFDGRYSTNRRWVKNALGHQTVFTYYLPLGQVQSETDPNGKVYTYVQDAAGRLRVMVKPGDTVASPTFTATYSDYVSSQNPFSQTATQKIDDSGANSTRRFISMTRFYNGFGELLQTKLNDVKPFVWNGANLQMSCGVSYTTCDIVTDTTSFYDDLADDSTTANQLGLPASTGTVWIQKSFLPKAVAPRSTYGLSGSDWSATVTNDRGQAIETVSTALLSAGQTTKIRNTTKYESAVIAAYPYNGVSGGVWSELITSITYDGSSGSETERSSTMLINDIGQVLQSTGPGPAGSKGSTENVYDNAGRVIKTTRTDGDGSRGKFTSETVYNWDGSVASIKDQDLSAVYKGGTGTLPNNGALDPGAVGTRAYTYTYDPYGRMSNSVDPLGNHLQYTYDDLGRMTTKIKVGPPNTTLATYTYDTVGYKGLLSQKSYSGGSQTFSYDDRGRVTQRVDHIDTLDFTTQYGYNSADQPTQMKYPNTPGQSPVVDDSLKFIYDDRMLLSQITWLNNAGNVLSNLVTNTSYDEAGRMLSRDYSNYQFKETITYNAANDVGAGAMQMHERMVVANGSFDVPTLSTATWYSSTTHVLSANLSWSSSNPMVGVELWGWNGTGWVQLAEATGEPASISSPPTTTSYTQVKVRSYFLANNGTPRIYSDWSSSKSVLPE